jgi:hypothetical protein
MTRRWALAGVVSLLICSALLIVLVIRTPTTSPTTIRGVWYREQLAGESRHAYQIASPNPNHLSALLIFGQDGIFIVEDPILLDIWSRRQAVPVRYPGSYTFVGAQHIQLTIGTITTTYEIAYERAGTRDELDRLILRNQGMTYTYYRTHIPLEM